MNQASNSFLKKFILYFLVPFVMIKLLYSVGSFFLVKDDITMVKNIDLSYHYSLNIVPKILQTTTSKTGVKQVQTSSRIKDIKLKGIYIEDVNSFIVIEDQLGTTFLYRGDKYVGYVLKEIYDNRAVFEKNGVNYDLVISEESTDKRTSYNSSTAVSSSINNSSDDMQTNFEPVKITRDELNDYVKNPNKIWQNIRIQEVRKSGQIDGYRVNYVKKGSFFDASGIKSGDVIKGIDGKEIKSLADVMKYYNNINDLDGLALSIARGDNEIDLEFNIN